VAVPVRGRRRRLLFIEDGASGKLHLGRRTFIMFASNANDSTGADLNPETTSSCGIA
jgi:hypothetical protein